MNTVQEERIGYYVNLCHQSTTFEEAKNICVQCTSDEQLYVFAEILSTPLISGLNKEESENEEDKKQYYNLIELFAHGLLKDYYDKDRKKKVPELNENQIHKLKLLTFVTLVNGKSLIEYKSLYNELLLLDNDNKDEEIEQIICDCISNGIIRGKMNQHLKSIQISHSIGRDIIDNESINKMTHFLNQWLINTQSLLHMLDQRILYVSNKTNMAINHETQINQNISQARLKFSSTHNHLSSSKNLNDVLDDDDTDDLGHDNNNTNTNTNTNTNNNSNSPLMMVTDGDDEIVAMYGDSLVRNGSAGNRSMMGRSPRRRMSRPSPLSRFEP